MRQHGRWQGYYEEWLTTPIKEVGNIHNYLDEYGYGAHIPVDKNIEDINAAISKPGSYYAYGRIGLIIVAPEQGKIFYVYNG